MLIAVRVTDQDELLLANVQAVHSDRAYSASSVEVDSSKHDWGNYFLAGYKGTIEHAKVSKPAGMQCMIAGTVPQGSGLSSSSAFVVCSALATMHANKLQFGKRELATMCAKAEHYVGTEGGG